jgi:hypothetical protein
MQPQFYYLAIVLSAFVTFMVVVGWLQVTDARYRRMQAKITASGKVTK